jgi:hypothetical protein
MVVHTCKSSYTGGKGRRIMVWASLGGGEEGRGREGRGGKALSSNPGILKKNFKNQENKTKPLRPVSPSPGNAHQPAEGTVGESLKVPQVTNMQTTV